MNQYLIAHIGHTTKWCEHVTWWRPDSCGYTVCIDKAGLYGEDEARSIASSGLCIAVLKADAEPLARTTPYYRLGNGNLARLYDGGDHRPVPNSREAWKVLLLKSAFSSPRGERPTPITSTRARAIYLDTLAKAA